MSSWAVAYTEHAERDLRDLYEYIAFSLLAPDIARKQTRRIVDAVAKLDELPHRFPLYDKEPWRGKGLRVLPVDNYLAFYLPVESQQTVLVIRIMYGGRDIEAQLRQDVNAKLNAAEEQIEEGKTLDARASLKAIRQKADG